MIARFSLPLFLGFLLNDKKEVTLIAHFSFPHGAKNPTHLVHIPNFFFFFIWTT